MTTAELLKTLSDEQTAAFNAALIEQRTALQAAFAKNEQELVAAHAEIISSKDAALSEAEIVKTDLQSQLKEISDKVDLLGGTEMAEQLRKQKRLDEIAAQKAALEQEQAELTKE